MYRVLEAFRLSQDRRGRAAYVFWLEARAENEGGKIDAKAMEAIRGGWYLGEQGFKDNLLGLWTRPERKSGTEGVSPVRRCVPMTRRRQSASSASLVQK